MNKFIDELINLSIEKNYKTIEDIHNIASIFEYHTPNDNVELSVTDIKAINEKRKDLMVIRNIIDALESLKK